MEQPVEAERVDNRIRELRKCIDEEEKKIQKIVELYEAITDSEIKQYSIGE